MLLILRQDSLESFQPPALGVQVSLSAFAFLFSEIVQYSQTRVSNIGELERRCAALSQRALFLSRCRVGIGSVPTFAVYTTSVFARS